MLGVLFHISNDFDKAIDAFKTAVKLRPGMEAATPILLMFFSYFLCLWVLSLIR